MMFANNLESTAYYVLQCRQHKMNIQGWLKKNLIPLLGLLFVVAVTVAIFLVYRNFPRLFNELRSYGYLGAFLISLLLNATVILPAGNFLILFTLAAVSPIPVLVGVAGGAGAALGEMTGYMAGRSGRAVVTSKEKTYARLEQWVKKGGSLTIFVFSVIPMVFDLVGIAAGVLRFPFWKFLLFCWLGRTVLYVGIALAAPWGLEVVVERTEPISIGITAALATLLLLVIGLALERWQWNRSR